MSDFYKCSITVAQPKATVLLNGIERTTMEVSEGTVVKWVATKENYVTDRGEVEVSGSNFSLKITLKTETKGYKQKVYTKFKKNAKGQYVSETIPLTETLVPATYGEAGKYLYANEDGSTEWKVVESSKGDVEQLKVRMTRAESDIVSLNTNKAEKANTLAGYNIGDAYTKTEVDAKMSCVFHYKGQVEKVADLPTEGNQVGDVYNVKSTGANYAWSTSNEWDKLSETIDLSPYAKTADVNTAMAEERTTRETAEGVLRDRIAAEETRASTVEINLSNTKADKTELTPLATKEEVNSGLATKADKTIVEEALALKADKSEIVPLATKEEVNDGLAVKADKTELVPLATKEEVNSGLALKADATVVESELALKADKTELTPLATKQELTDGLATKADIATTLDGYGITDAYTKEEVDKKVVGAYKFKGSVETYEDLLAIEEKTVGDVYNVIKAHKTEPKFSAGSNFAWNGTEWDILGGTLDLTEYAKIEYVDSEVAVKADKTELLPLATKDEVNNGLALKADKTTVEESLALKADKTELTPLATKQELTDGLATKADIATTLAGYGITDAYTRASMDIALGLKQNNLTEAQLSAVDSGISAVKVEAYDEHKNDTTMHITADERTTWNTVSDKADSTYVDTQIANEGSVRENADDTLRNLISSEASSREFKDAEINGKIGGNFTKENTVAMAISAETSAREISDTAINEKIGDGFSKDNTVADAITDEASVREEVDAAIQGNVDALTSRLAMLEEKVEGMRKTNVEPVAVESGSVSKNDSTKDFVVSGNITEAGSSITGKSLTLKDSTMTLATTSSKQGLMINATTDVEIKNVTIDASVTGSSNALNINNAEYVVLRDVEISGNTYNSLMSAQSQGGTTTTVFPKNVLIDNCNFNETCKHIYLWLAGLADGAVVTISNCHFASCEQFLCVSSYGNKNNNITINIINCSIDEYEHKEGDTYNGIIICDDRHSTSYEEFVSVGGFNKLKINIANLVVAGNLITQDTFVMGSQDMDQMLYMFVAKENKNVLMSDETRSLFPTVTVQ